MTRPALKEFRKLTGDVQRRIAPPIDALAADPRPVGVEKLTDEGDLYRIRVGNFRVVYTVRDDALVVIVVRVADRRDVYRGRGH